MHHVVPASRGGTRTVPLCHACHGLVHDISRQSLGALTKAALAAKSRRGEVVGQVPYGYDGKDGKLVLNGPEQFVIQSMRALRGEGLSFRAIASELSARGVVNRKGNPIAYSQVARTLKREHAG